ncbi:MAG: transglutaminase family protein [Methylobacteriaceae bacterium]|nr:transglutaminase family protein [Rhodoblastus sp.]MCC0005368.1 transglutaminase family protein [Methylobacteriaceae bacterium]
MRISIRHIITQEFTPPARSVIQLMRLRPRACESQSVMSWSIDADVDCQMREQQDAFGNFVQTLDADGPLQKLTVTARGEVETFDTAGVLRNETERFSPEVYLRDTDLTEADPALRKFAREAIKGAKTELDRPHFLMRAVNEAIAFEAARKEPVSAIEVFKAKTGASCELAHVFIAAARSVGAPARFVSGYLASESDGADRAADASDLRGWAEAYVEGLGWIGFDPSICLCMHDGHVRLAVALDYLGAAPLRVSPLLSAKRSMEARAAIVQGQAQRQA